MSFTEKLFKLDDIFQKVIYAEGQKMVSITLLILVLPIHNFWILGTIAAMLYVLIPRSVQERNTPFRNGERLKLQNSEGEWFFVRYVEDTKDGLAVITRYRGTGKEFEVTVSTEEIKSYWS